MILFGLSFILYFLKLSYGSNFKEFMICHYCLFNLRYEFPDYVCNGCHDLTMLCADISNITIITVKNVGYRCIIHNIIKSEAINLLKKFCS